MCDIPAVEYYMAVREGSDVKYRVMQERLTLNEKAGHRSLYIFSREKIQGGKTKKRH